METLDAMRGPNSTSLIPAALECSICQEIMLFPYCLTCGHTFCGLCLKHWMVNRQEGQHDKTCPACRDTIRSTPILVHALRELALHVLGALETHDPAKAAQVRETAAGDPGQQPFSDIYFPNPIRDDQDEVVRCQNCMWEVQDGECVNCGQVQGAFHAFSDQYSDEEALSMDEDMPNSDDLGFVDDDDEDEEDQDEDQDEDDSDEPDAIANIQRGAGPRRVTIDSESESDLEVVGMGMGMAHRPIVISDSSSSDVMSPSEESEAIMTDEQEVEDIDDESDDGY